MKPSAPAAPARRRPAQGAIILGALAWLAAPALPAHALRGVEPREPAAVIGIPDAATAPIEAGAAQDPGCQLCHDELELLRQQSPSLDAARRLLVPRGTLEASAHAAQSCGSCHTGFGTFPHPGQGPATRTCVSCHEDHRELWETSIHAEDDGATCVSCHGVHEVAPAELLAEPRGIRRMNGACVACHDTSALPPSDPHADTVSCASCHTAHTTARATEPGAAVAPLDQAETCGACHQEVGDRIRSDAHRVALEERGVQSLALLRGGDGHGPPTCTSCHGAHGMLAPSHPRFDQEMVDPCAACHSDYADTYFGTYHGKATAVGSEIVATCDHCHGSHDIFPASDGRSMVSGENLVDTCRTCHLQASPSFVLYDSHPDPLDRDRNPPLFYSFVFMNVLLGGVLVVFGLHTALWWVRLMLDRRRGVAHGLGGDHG